MTKFRQQYLKVVVPRMEKIFGYKNNLAVPRITGVVVNVGTSRAIKEPKLLEVMAQNLAALTGQKPVKTKARKAISGFNIKQGMIVGLKVTLHGVYLEEFLYKLVNIALPRVRDFRGLKLSAVDQQGNCSIGIVECTVFPEINPNKVEVIHGLEVCVTTSAKTRQEGLALLRLVGFPFRKK